MDLEIEIRFDFRHWIYIKFNFMEFTKCWIYRMKQCLYVPIPLTRVKMQNPISKAKHRILSISNWQFECIGVFWILFFLRGIFLTAQNCLLMWWSGWVSKIRFLSLFCWKSRPKIPIDFVELIYHCRYCGFDLRYASKFHCIFWSWNDR